MWCTTQAGGLRCGNIQLLGTGGLWRHANVRRSISSIPSCFNAAPKRPRGQVTYRPYHTSFPTVSGAASSFQIFFDRISHDVLYIIARATFQKVLPPEFKLLQGYTPRTASTWTSSAPCCCRPTTRCLWRSSAARRRHARSAPPGEHLLCPVRGGAVPPPRYPPLRRACGCRAGPLPQERPCCVHATSQPVSIALQPV